MQNYFPEYEQKCPCCGLNKVPDHVLSMANKARYYADRPIYVNSWTRCIVHNNDVKGSPTSSHLDGYALDVRLNHKKGISMTSRERFILISALLKAGFTRILIYKTFIHADADPNKVDQIITIKEV